MAKNPMTTEERARLVKIERQVNHVLATIEHETVTLSSLFRVNVHATPVSVSIEGLFPGDLGRAFSGIGLTIRTDFEDVKGKLVPKLRPAEISTSGRWQSVAEAHAVASMLARVAAAATVFEACAENLLAIARMGEAEAQTVITYATDRAFGSGAA